MTKQSWHAIPEAVFFERLETGRGGLDSGEAADRLIEYGPNVIEEARRTSPIELLIAQFRNVLILTLLAATVLSAFLGHTVEAVAIAVIVLLAVLLGFVQEFRAGKAIEALKKMAAPNARVIRDGSELLVPAANVVPGDIVLISAGDRISADCRLFEAFNLTVDEASLTGESIPSAKDASALLTEVAAVGDRKNMLFAGTSAVNGRGRAVVTSTGMQTEFGRIAGLLQTVDTGKTPLQKNLDQVGKSLARAALLIVVAIVGLGLFRGQPFVELLVFGIALAVAVVPEALPAVVTISLALGVQRMARRNALMRRLPAVETLGCTTVICSDKTGTLTRDEMTVRALYADGQVAKVSGSGYRPEGSFALSDGTSLLTRPFIRLLESGVLCNDARLEPGKGSEWSIAGDPTEAALIVVARKAGIVPDELKSRYPRIAEEPFSSVSKRMVSVHRDGDSVMTIIKGAPEVVLQASASCLDSDGAHPLDEEGVARIMGVAESMGRDALRVLAIAVRDGVHDVMATDGLLFLGLVGMIDPPRSEAKEAVARCLAAGIRPVMITGDHPVTARAIAEELGILRQGRVMAGSDLQGLDVESLRKLVAGVDVFARVAPEHKLRIVEALQAEGEVVAMTGDGVNDAPALKRADIGISMGITGTDVSREASAMTLTDDDFSTIVAAVEEGRGIFDNIRKYLTYLLSSNIGELGLMAGATLLGIPLPLTAVQILYVNLATDGLPALALAVDPAEPDIMQRPPNDPKQGVFTRPVVALMLAGGIWSTIINLVLFEWARHSERPLPEAMTMTFVSLVLIQFFKAYSFRSEQMSIFRRPFTNKWLNLAVAWELCMLAGVIYVPFIAEPFSVYRMPLGDWLIVLVGAASVVPVIESVKWSLRNGIYGSKA